MVIESVKELHLSTYIQLRMTKHPSRKVTNFRHLLSCGTIERQGKLLFKINYAFDKDQTTRFKIM